MRVTTLLSMRDLKCHFRGHFNCSYRMDRQTNFFLIQYIEMLDNVAKISILNSKIFHNTYTQDIYLTDRQDIWREGEGGGGGGGERLLKIWEVPA